MFERELRLNGLMNGYLVRLLDDFDDGQLEQPIVAGGNPPAWILAHLAVANDYALRMLGEPRLAPAEWHKRFGPGRTPKDDSNPLPSKMELAEKLTKGHQALLTAAPKADPERMNVPQTVEFFKGTPVETIGDVVAHLLTTHLAIHLGQLSAWRRTGTACHVLSVRKQPMWFAWVVIALFVFAAVFSLAWRWGSRKWSLPCPTILAWSLENPRFQRIAGTTTTLDRMDLRPGQRILEIGPGPGRLLIPAAQRILPNGEAFGIDIQAGMIDRLQARARQATVTNLTAILGDATQPHVPEASFDRVFLCTVLGEVPNRDAVLNQACRALKPGGMLSITEKVGDPHYQSRSTVMRLVEKAGLRTLSIEGGWWFFTANFVKP